LDRPTIARGAYTLPVPIGPLLSEFWRDVLAVASAIITVLSLLYAILQIRKTKSAAIAAKEAVEKVHEESQRNFQRYALTNALRFMTEAKVHAESRAWDKAALRLGDLADQAAQLAYFDEEWKQLAVELRRWEDTMKRVGSQKANLAPMKWSAFLLRVQLKVDESHGPFRGLGPEEQR